MRATTRRTLALLFVGLLVVPGQAVGVVQGSPDLAMSLSDDVVTPGADTRLAFTLTNEGGVESGSAGNPSLGAQVTTARGVDATLSADGAPLEVETGTQSLGRLAQGGQAQLGYDVAVAENADPGTYTMELTVEYRYTSSIAESSGARNQATETRTFDVTVEVDDRARFEVVSTETDVRVGSAGSVDVTMRNVGTEAATATTVALESPNADLTFAGTTAASRFAGDWGPGETRTLSYQVRASPDAQPQRYALTATATFDDAGGTTRESDALSLGVTPGPEQAFGVVGVDGDVAVGDTGTVAVTLENTGAVAVDDATVRLQSRSPALRFGNGSAATRFVGTWEPGAERTVAFDVTATDAADTRSYALQATVAYDDTDGDAATAPPLSLGLTPDPERGFALSNVSSTLRVGEEGTLRGTLANDGATVARNVVLRFTTEHQQIEPVTRTYSVGTLQPGESADVAFDAEVGEAADAGPRQFSFVAEYRTGDGERRTSDDLLTRQRIAPGGEVFEIAPVNATYAPGGGGTLTVRVTNTGAETVSSVSAKLFADDPISANDKEAFVDELQPGASTTVTFSVSAAGDALAKTYPVSVDLQYEDADGDTHVSDSHQVALTVTEPTSDGDGGGLPVTLVGLAAVGVVGVGGYLRFRS